MIERLEAIHSRFIFLTEELMKPEIISDIKKTLELTKEQANLQDADTAYMEYKNILKANMTCDIMSVQNSSKVNY